MAPVNVFNNTILVPQSGKLDALPKNTVAADLAKVKDQSWNQEKEQDVYIKVNGASSQKIIAIQNMYQFSMTRENEQKRSGGNSDYVVNLPGKVTYSELTFSHAFTREGFFLKWLMDNTTKNGTSRADIEIHISVNNADKKEMVFTLCDAFPINWEIKNFEVQEDSPLLLEYVSLAFSEVTFKLTDIPQN